MRICSLLPSGTEILYAVGLGESVVGVSHECDYPPDALNKPKVLRSRIDPEQLTSEEIDQAVRRSLEHGESLYEIDEETLRRAQPDLIITQTLCEVCAIGTSQVSEAVRHLSSPPRVLSLHPHTLEEALEDIRLVGEATGRQREADRLARACRERISRVQTLVAHAPRPRVVCMEWLSPPMCGGHWVPEQVALAGGEEVVGQAGRPSRYVTADELVAARPDVVCVMPCGFPIERTRRELPLLTTQSWWKVLPAVHSGRVYLVNGPAYFNRSGPRLVDGIELLAGLLHPDLCEGLMPYGGVQPVERLV